MKILTKMDQNEAQDYAYHFAHEQEKKPWCANRPGWKGYGSPCLGNGWLMTGAIVDPAPNGHESEAKELTEEMAGKPMPQRAATPHVRPWRVSPCPCRGA